MREVMTDLLRWWREGGVVGVGSVVRTFKSAPRPAGASMLVGPDGTAVGSVSGGCVEGAVYERGEAIRDGEPPELHRYGVSDSDAFEVGLTCGGIIDIFTERISRQTFPELESLAASIDAGDPVAVATVIAGTAEQLGRHLLVRPDDTEGSLGSQRLDLAVRDDVRGLLAAGRTATLTYGPDGQRRGEGLQVFVASYAPPPRMLVFGAIDFAAAVARIGAFLGYRVTVCDARPVFATRQRFADAHEVVVQWPHRYLQEQLDAGAIDRRTVICVLTHDPKFDVPVLEIALRLEGPDAPAYIGAMGSRRTHDDRFDRLREAGLGDVELARLASPIGLDLGARTPEETAVSIAAEIIARQWNGGGQPLSALDRAIHVDPVADHPAAPELHR
ncbi:XdhC family protein [Nakamurella lactea]|uniref:XdhC family protein n=1 Tax=Nakamurella lactea TaxID=459515 RepID=UPI00055DB4AD|nr:XdhC/CoxI family protein [Nakamurella lactea]